MTLRYSLPNTARLISLMNMKISIPGISKNGSQSVLTKLKKSFFFSLLLGMSIFCLLYMTWNELVRLLCLELTWPLLCLLLHTRYVNRMLMQINQRLYLLSQLKLQGIWTFGITHIIYWSYHVQDYIAHALPAFAGQLTADDRNRICAISRKTLRRGVTHTAFDIEEIIDSADRKLFNRIVHQLGHCLYHLIPPKTSVYCPYSLHKRQHSYQLPNIEFSQHKNSFINQCFFKFRWLLDFTFSLFHVLLCVNSCYV